AFLIKPTMFVFTGQLMGCALVLEIIAEILLERKSLRDLLVGSSVVVLTATAVAAPYYWFNGRHVLQYIHANYVAQNADVWAYRGSWLGSLLFYVTGEGHKWMIGRHERVLIAIIFIAGFEACRARRWPHMVRGSMLGAMTILA